MVEIVETSETDAISIEEFCDEYRAQGLSSASPEGLKECAPLLRRLSNNKRLVVDHIRDALMQPIDARTRSVYSAQAMIMYRQNGIYLRCAVWPGVEGDLYGVSSNRAFTYEFPHDHNFDFLTIGHLGPGYETTCYEYDYDVVDGYVGEQVDLKPLGRFRLNLDETHLYRGHRTIHVQHPPQSTSVSLNLMGTGIISAHTDQYIFDPSMQHISEVATPNGLVHLLAIYTATEHVESSLDMIDTIATNHPNGQVRAAAVRAIQGIACSPDIKESIYLRAMARGNPLVKRAAQTALDSLASQ